MFQLLRRPCLEGSYLRMPLEDLRPVRSCGDLSCQILSGGMPLHMRACSPERTFGYVKNFSLKGDINRFSVFSIKRSQFFGGHLSHVLALVQKILKIIPILHSKDKDINWW